MQQAFVFSGFGGQGVMFIGQLLGYAALDEGREVTWIPSYGPEMRGGTAHCTVVIADSMIGSPIVSRPQIAVVFNQPSFDKYEPLVADGGLLVINTSMVEHASERTDIELLSIPATDMAYELGNPRLTNVVLLGATLAVRAVLPLDAVRRALASHIPAHRRSMLEVNLKALERGAEFAGQMVGS